MLSAPPLSAEHTLNEQIEEDIVAVAAMEPRDYLGMSSIGYCARRLYNELVFGRQMSAEETRRMARYHETGYMHEARVKERLLRMGIYRLGSEVEVLSPLRSASGVEYKGHTDGETHTERLLEIKSASCGRYRQVLQRGVPLYEHRCQTQSYLRHGKPVWQTNGALVVYVNRCHYQWMALHEPYDPSLAEQMDAKAALILDCIDRRVAPSCTCGKCV